MGWRRWFGRDATPGGPRDAVVTAIAGLRRDQAELDARLGVAVVDTAVLTWAVHDQRRLLDEAAGQIRDATAAAQAAADEAAADGGEPAAAPYRQAAAGFAAQQELVRAGRAQLERLTGGAEQNLERTRQLLRDSAASLDRALRAEVELLGRLEHLDRQRVIARMRRERNGGGPG